MLGCNSLVSSGHSQIKQKYGVLKGSVLRPLLFILFINDLRKEVEFSTAHQFADDTNMLFMKKSLKK